MFASRIDRPQSAHGIRRWIRVFARSRRDVALAILPFEVRERPSGIAEHAARALANELIVRARDVTCVVEVIAEAAHRDLQQLHDGIVRGDVGIQERAHDVFGDGLRRPLLHYVPVAPFATDSTGTVGTAPPIEKGAPIAMFGALTTPRSAMRIAV